MNFILDTAKNQIVGFGTVASGSKVLIGKAEDLLNFTKARLLKLYNAVNATDKTETNMTEEQLAERIFKKMAIHFDRTATDFKVARVIDGKIVERHFNIIDTPANTEVRNSRLNRMAQAFVDNKKGLAIDEIRMIVGDMTEQTTGQYLTVLSSANDRYNMNIVKDGENGIYKLAK
jgi:hypothetical protein